MMKRRAVMLVFLVVGGAVINWLIAWYLPRFGPERIQFPTTYVGSDMERLDRGHPSVGVLAADPVLTAFGRQRSYGWGFDKEVIYATGARGFLDNRSITRGRCGWPLRSLHGSYTTGIGLEHAIEIPDSPLMPKRALFTGGLPFLPIGIIPLGFAVNTLFYASLLWLMFFAPGALRRARRRRRNLCIRCAYPIGESVVCTECGAAVNIARMRRCMYREPLARG